MCISAHMDEDIFSLSLWLRDDVDVLRRSSPADEAMCATLTVSVLWDAHHMSLPNMKASPVGTYYTESSKSFVNISYCYVSL